VLRVGVPVTRLTPADLIELQGLLDDSETVLDGLLAKVRVQRAELGETEALLTLAMAMFACPDGTIRTLLLAAVLRIVKADP
jgi:hypothetical protein